MEVRFIQSESTDTETPKHVTSVLVRDEEEDILINVGFKFSTSQPKDFRIFTPLDHRRRINE